MNLWRKYAFEFAKDKYFNGYPDTRLVQENFNLTTSFIQDSVDKHIPSKTSWTLFGSLDYLRIKKEDSQKKQNSY